MAVLKEITLPKENQVHLPYPYIHLWDPVLWTHWMTKKS